MNNQLDFKTRPVKMHDDVDMQKAERRRAIEEHEERKKLMREFGFEMEDEK